MDAKTIKFRGKTYVRVAEGAKTWVEYERDAHVAFLTDLARKIKEVAGGHAEGVEVKKGRSTAWLEYKGQDLSDHDMTWWCHILPKELFDVSLDWEATSALRGQFKGSVDYKHGELTVDAALRSFVDAFGRG